MLTEHCHEREQLVTQNYLMVVFYFLLFVYNICEIGSRSVSQKGDEREGSVWAYSRPQSGTRITPSIIGHKDEYRR